MTANVDWTYIIWITNFFNAFRIEIAYEQKFCFSIFRCHSIQFVHVVIVHAENVIVFLEIRRFDLVQQMNDKINFIPYNNFTELKRCTHLSCLVVVC